MHELLRTIVAPPASAAASFEADSDLDPDPVEAWNLFGDRNLNGNGEMRRDSDGDVFTYSFLYYIGVGVQ